MQQVLAFESDLLDHDDLFTGSVVVDNRVEELVRAARAEIDKVLDLGGAVAGVETGYMKSRLVASLASRRRRIESGEDVVVGVNAYTTTEPSPLTVDSLASVQAVDPVAEGAAVERLADWRSRRDDAAVAAALARLCDDAGSDRNLMPASLECARAGVTTGEWTDTLRQVFGEYRAPTGVGGAAGVGEATESLVAVRELVELTSRELGGRLRFLVGKPGLDGHSNGAEQIALRARDAGFEVVYQGIRLTPAQIVAAAVAEDVDVVGLSVLSGSHLSLVPQVVEGLRAAGLGDVPVVVGGIIPPDDADVLRAQGVAAVFTPKDYAINDIMREVVTTVRSARGLPA
jgi:(2R)-ethylmalonyl-CoA mutase